MEYMITEEPKGEVYKKFIKYACNKSNILSFNVVIRIAHEKEIEKEFNKLCVLLEVDKEEVIKNYNNPDFIDNIFYKLKNRKGIIRKWTNPLKGIERKFKKEEIREIKDRHIKMDIENIIFKNAGKIIFNDRMKEIRKKLEEDFIKIESIVNNSKVMNDYDVYYYKNSNRVETLLMNQERLYNMIFPNFPEDIRFFKNDYNWFKTISHEEIALISIKDLEEYNYLKSIGLKLEKYQ